MVMMHQEGIGLRERVAELTRHPNTTAIAIGVATVALTPVIVPLVKPVLKNTIKTGVTWYEKTKSALAETAESLADIAAEAKAEAHGAKESSNS